MNLVDEDHPDANALLEEMLTSSLNDIELKRSRSAVTASTVSTPTPALALAATTDTAIAEYINRALDAAQPIEWSRETENLLPLRLFDELEVLHYQDDANMSEQSFRRMLFELINCVLIEKQAFGGRKPPEPWHSRRQSSLVDHFWLPPTYDAVFKSVKAMLGPQMQPHELLRDNIDQLVESEIRKEDPEWIGFEEEITEVKFEVADLIFEEQLSDIANYLSKRPATRQH